MMSQAKQDLSSFIQGINGIISDLIFNETYAGGEYKFHFNENLLNVSFTLSFKEGDDEMILIHRSAVLDKEEHIEMFNRMCYNTTLRTILFGKDVVFGTMLNSDTNDFYHYLSLDTLSKEGLKKFREWKQASKENTNTK